MSCVNLDSPESCRLRADLLQARLFLRNPLLEPRVWILDPVFGDFGGPFWLILADSGASGPQTSILDVLTDLGTQNESSGACVRPNFVHFREKCKRFSKISNFKIKKSSLQSLYFLIRSFLSGSCPVLSYHPMQNLSDAKSALQC